MEGLACTSPGALQAMHVDISTRRRDQLRLSNVECTIQDSLLDSVVRLDGIVHKVATAFDYNLNGTITFELCRSLLRMQLRASIGRRGSTKLEQVDVIQTTGPGMFSRWAKKHGLQSKPLLTRWVKETTRNHPPHRTKAPSTPSGPIERVHPVNAWRYIGRLRRPGQAAVVET